MSLPARPLGWLGIVRVGLVQTALGAIVVLTTSTLNRVMVVEMALPAMLPGALVGWHYAVQLLRPRLGYGSDLGRRRTPWIVGGMAVLAGGAILAALATAWMAASPAAGIALAVVAFTAIGIGVGAAGTSLLVLLAKRVDPGRRGAAATIVWMMMIAGFVLTATVAGSFLDPFSPARLVMVTSVVAMAAFVLALAAVWGVEGAPEAGGASAAVVEAVPAFREALAEVWAEPLARRFTIFVFISMLAYSAQDLILEPFAGEVFGLTPGASTKLSGVQHGGVFTGMLLVAVVGTRWRKRMGSLRAWVIGGCIGSSIALLGLAAGGFVGPGWPLQASVFALGTANGAFAVAAIGSMMAFAGSGRQGREGVRMGLWGAAQAIAFGIGGFAGTVAVDVMRRLSGSPLEAYATVFAAEALLFLYAAGLAARVEAPTGRGAREPSEQDQGPEMGAQMNHEAMPTPIFDAVVVGGGPAGATAATDLARRGLSVLLLDRAGRIKPCGGAIPPRLIQDFAIPDQLLVARATSARMISPADRKVDMPIEGGFVGMVDREAFDEWLRERAAAAGAQRREGFFERLSRDADGTSIVHFRAKGGEDSSAMDCVRARVVIGADGATSMVARQSIAGAASMPYVYAYHEIVRSPPVSQAAPFDGARCDVYYRGALSPDFYGWVFPHGDTTSVGTGTANRGFSLRKAVSNLRAAAGLGAAETIRREGAPIPMRPLKRWDNGRDVVLAGDAAGVVAPASGEGIYYAMAGGRLAADAAARFLATGDARALREARANFMKAHGRVFFILGIMQRFWYSSDGRRERFVGICRDRDVQRLTWEAYMNKRLVRARPMAHVRIFFKDLAHLLGLVPP